MNFEDRVNLMITGLLYKTLPNYFSVVFYYVVFVCKKTRRGGRGVENSLKQISLKQNKR